MVFEVRNELKDLSERDLVVDPACGTGVFVVETVEPVSYTHLLSGKDG